MKQTANRASHGFTLTEMLVTLLILTLASTLLATGIPVAIDTYHRTVNSANAQMALSTTATVLRSEIGLASEVIQDPSNNQKIFYLSDEGSWVSIEPSTDYSARRGLQKQYYIGDPGTSHDVSKLTPDGAPYGLISNAAIGGTANGSWDTLKISLGSMEVTSTGVIINNLVVTDPANNELAKIEDYQILMFFKN